MTDDEGTAFIDARDLSQRIEASKVQTPIPETSLYPALSPIEQYSTYKTKEEITGTVGRLISDHLNKGNTVKASLISAFESYFERIGIENNFCDTRFRLNYARSRN